ncbi:MAG TPA: hypothetical protein VKB08_06945 [Bradyrhizobium sp.]|nr:hypothetical protein [Bradyrhizobium sp.]
MLPRLAAPIIVVTLVTLSMSARADGREELNACQVMIDRVAQAPQADTASVRQDDAALQRCRQIVRDWTLRESRMSVDEHGRPLR